MESTSTNNLPQSEAEWKISPFVGKCFTGGSCGANISDTLHHQGQILWLFLCKRIRVTDPFKERIEGVMCHETE